MGLPSRRLIWAAWPLLPGWAGGAAAAGAPRPCAREPARRCACGLAWRPGESTGRRALGGLEHLEAAEQAAFGDLVEHLQVVANEGWLEQQVFGRIARQGELGEGHQLGDLLLGGMDRGDDPIASCRDGLDPPAGATQIPRPAIELRDE